jgi:hypothetical protein
VWIRGLAFGLPLVPIVTQVIAYRRLKAQGQTSWDADGGYVVTHPRQGAAQQFTIIAIVVLILVLAGLGMIASR